MNVGDSFRNRRTNVSHRERGRGDGKEITSEKMGGDKKLSQGSEKD